MRCTQKLGRRGEQPIHLLPPPPEQIRAGFFIKAMTKFCFLNENICFIDFYFFQAHGSPCCHALLLSVPFSPSPWNHSQAELFDNEHDSGVSSAPSPGVALYKEYFHLGCGRAGWLRGGSAHLKLLEQSLGAFHAQVWCAKRYQESQGGEMDADAWGLFWGCVFVSLLPFSCPTSRNVLRNMVKDFIIFC